MTEPRPTTVYFDRPEWEFLKRAAAQRAIQCGGRASVSRVLRDLVSREAASEQRATA